MQIIKTFFISLMVFIPFLKASASGLKDSASVGVNTYSDNGDVRVYSPTFSFMKTMSKNFLIGFKMRVDAISSASITNGGSPVMVDAVAGASAKEGFDDTRYAPTFLMAYEDAKNAASGGVYYSTENDYDGMSVFGSYVRQFNEENTAVGIGFSQSNDKWAPVFKRDLPRDNRKERKIDISVNQLLTPESSIQFVYSYMYSEGFLSSPYHFVVQDTFAKFENYPDTRAGNAYAIKGVVLLDEENAMNYSYRYYKDNWDISSHTVSAEWLSDFSDKLTSGLRVRYYTQSKASFAEDVGGYAKTDTYFAVDYRMSAFDSVDVGIPFIYRPSPISDFKITASVDYYRTSYNEYIKNWYDKNNLQAVYTTLNVEYDF